MSIRVGQLDILRLVSNQSPVVQSVMVSPKVGRGEGKNYEQLVDKAMLLHEDGTWSFSHICKEWKESDGTHVVKIVAPRLGEAHTVTQGFDAGHGPGMVHVEPSILCPDCGLHGYVRDNKWEPVK